MELSYETVAKMSDHYVNSYTNNKSAKLSSFISTDSFDLYMKLKRDIVFLEDEHNRFLDGVVMHGKNCSKIAEHMGNKTPREVSQYSEYFIKKIQINPNLPGTDLIANNFGISLRIEWGEEREC